MYKFCKCMKNLIDLDFKTGSLNLFMSYMKCILVCIFTYNAIIIGF